MFYCSAVSYCKKFKKVEEKENIKFYRLPQNTKKMMAK